MNSGDYLIGLDLGTSACKCAVIRTDGVLLARAAIPYPLHSPRPGWSEQDPADWTSAAVAALKRAIAAARISPSRVAAISLSGQMHTAVFLGEEMLPLRPAIVWSDRRSAVQAEQVMQRIGQQRLISLTGNRLAAGFTLASWLWLRDNEPDVHRQTHLLLFPKDYLRLFLTGSAVSEPTDASASGFFDPFAVTWCKPLLDELGLDAGILPTLMPSASPAGGLLPRPAALCGLLPGTPIVHGGSDQSMQALGNGIIHPGQLSSTIGTGGQIFAPLASPVPDPEGRLHLFCHAIPGTWHLEAAVLSAGASLQWLRHALSPGETFQSLADSAAGISPGSEGLYFLPYLAGERTPHFQAQLRGVFAGLSLQHTRAHLVRAVMEGVVFAMRQGLDLIRASGVHPHEIAASGTAAVHPLWLQLQADIYNFPVYIPRTGETDPASGENVENHSQAGSAAAIGAALLAGMGVGVYPDAVAASQFTGSSQTVFPDPERSVRYADLYSGYVRLAESGLALPPASMSREE